MDQVANKPLRQAAIIIIGDEILSGRTMDTNLSCIARILNRWGISLKEARIIPDHIETIARTLNALRHHVDYVFTTGGIGPTHDDITAQAIALAFNRQMERNPQAVELLQAHYTPETLNEARLSMADMPVGAELIDNPVSRAPGFRIENVYVLAGVPKIMQAMLESLSSHLGGGAAILSQTLSAMITEGEISQGLRQIQGRYPDVKIGSYPYFHSRRLGVSIVVRTQDATKLDQCSDEVAALMGQLGETPTRDRPGSTSTD